MMNENQHQRQGDQDADQCLNAFSVSSACCTVQRHETILVRWTRVSPCLLKSILVFEGVEM